MCANKRKNYIRIVSKSNGKQWRLYSGSRQDLNDVYEMYTDPNRKQEVMDWHDMSEQEYDSLEITGKNFKYGKSDHKRSSRQFSLDKKYEYYRAKEVCDIQNNRVQKIINEIMLNSGTARYRSENKIRFSVSYDVLMGVDELGNDKWIGDGLLYPLLKVWSENESPITLWVNADHSCWSRFKRDVKRLIRTGYFHN